MASTVGTIMALLVFLTFLSLIVNQYVPVWMKDSEAAHMNGAFGQFGNLKSGIDYQVLAAMAALQSGTRYVPFTTWAAVTLGVDGVPVFTGPTIGELRLLPDEAPWSVEFVYSINGVPTRSSDRAAGQILLDVRNRYYVPQTLVYESGAVIRSQSNGQAVRAEPSFDVTTSNSTVVVSFTLISLFGTGSASGSSTDGVSAKLIGVDRQDYTGVRSAVWINHTTRYGVAWYGLFNDTLSKAFGVTPDRFGPCPSVYCFTGVYAQGRPTLLRASTPFYDVLTNISLTTGVYSVSVTLRNDWQNNDPIALGLSVVTVQRAFVNAAVGSAAVDVQP